MRRPRAPALACVVMLVSQGSAGAADFSRGGVFLPIGHGARAHGMGNAAIVSTRDDAATYWNPANLVWLEGQAGVTLMHAEFLPGVGSGYSAASAARAVGERLGEPEQTRQPRRWAYGAYFAHLGLEFEAGNWSENTLQLAVAHAINNYTSFGMSLKLLQLGNDFESGDAKGAGVDAGLGVLLTDRLAAAVVARDLWTRVAFDTDTWQTQSPALEIGVEYQPLATWKAEADVVVREGGLQRSAFGLEWRAYEGVLALRGGWTLLRAGDGRGYPSAGASLAHRRFVLDYAVSFDGADAFDTGQRFSLQVHF